MATETKIQSFVHKLEEGVWAKVILRFLLCASIAYVINCWMFHENGFKGLAHEQAMDQAQIAREIARGNGFTTKVIRPAALWQFESNRGSVDFDRMPDAYQAPLHPYINSVVLRLTNNTWFLSLTKSSWLMTPQDVSYINDKAIVCVQLVFFLLGVWVSYLIALRLFDQRLAILGICLVLVCELFWDFAFSGLPQMLMFFLFSCIVYCLIRAVEARYAGRTTLPWIIFAGIFFGLSALAHAITLWIFGGALLFALFFFRPIGRDAAILLAIVAIFYTPWMVRNQKVCGNPLGLGWYSGLYQIRGTESEVMRTMALEGPLKGVSPTVFRNKVQSGIIAQFGSIYRHLGYILVAPVFFVALLHLFKRPETAMFRWCILLMWLSALIGMATFGFSDLTVPGTPAPILASNDLHVLFIPLMTFYGLAYILVLWTRLEIHIKLIRYGFIGLLFIISGLPFLTQLIALHRQPNVKVQWPPYVPPIIAIMHKWTNEKEIIASDMPWAVSWYADRKSLWLPITVKDFITLNDYNQLGGRVVGLYLTPVSSDTPYISTIQKGEYKEWMPFITRRTESLRDFPLKAATIMPIDYQCIFYSDRDRWSVQED